MYPDPYMRTIRRYRLWTDTKTLDIIRISRELDSKGENRIHHIEHEFILKRQ